LQLQCHRWWLQKRYVIIIKAHLQNSLIFFLIAFVKAADLPRFRMSLIPNMSLRRLDGRIFWALVFMAVIMLLAGLAASVQLSGAEKSNEEEVTLLKQVAALQVLNAGNENSRNALDLIIQLKVTDLVGFVNNFERKIEPRIIEVGQFFNGTDPASLKFADIRAVYASITERIRAAQATPLTAAAEINFYQVLKTDLDRLDLNINSLLRDRQAAAENAHADYLAVMNQTRWSYLISGVLLFVLAILFALIIARLVAIPFALLAGRLGRMARGDLTEQIVPRGTEEVIELSRIFNRTNVNLKLAISRIQAQVKTINQASRQISQSSDRQVSNLSQQALAVAQVTATLGELSLTSQHIADSAAQVAGSADNALGSANAGYTTLLGASATMNEIRQKVNLIADRILALNSVAQRIREVTLLIDTLSNETHLLALNAAIESAGAGEEGLRFGVVAGHVRKLSQRSRVAAVEIQQLVSQIQNAAASSVMATEEGIKVVALGDKMVNDSLQANQNIITQIDQTSQLARGISLATEQQREASTQVAATMQELSQISNNISGNSQQYLASANDLEEVVRQLNGVVRDFIVEDSPDEPTATTPGTGLPAGLPPASAEADSRLSAGSNWPARSALP
jgi:methyl-accepting chemotaxis protein